MFASLAEAGERVVGFGCRIGADHPGRAGGGSEGLLEVGGELVEGAADALELVEEGLAAPFEVVEHPLANGAGLVDHRPALRGGGRLGLAQDRRGAFVGRGFGGVDAGTEGRVNRARGVRVVVRHPPMLLAGRHR